METKPAVKSITLWSNFIMAALVLFVPGFSDLGTEVVGSIVVVVNVLIRLVFTKTGLEGIL